jgi:HK97 family phage major capsid protein
MEDTETRSIANNVGIKQPTPDAGTPAKQDDAETGSDPKNDVKKDGKKLEGYAIVFNEPSKPLTADDGENFTEIIAPDALKDTDLSNVVMLSQHDYTKPIASVSAGTLKLDVDEKGLHYEADVPGTTDGKDLSENVSNGNIKDVSFRFANADDEWKRDEDGKVTRTIHHMDVLEISAVTVGAYDQPNVNVAKRSYTEFIQKNNKVEEDNMTTKILKDGKDNSELRSFEAYVSSKGEVRDGLTTDGSQNVLIPSEIVTPIFEYKQNKADLARFATVKSVNTGAGSYPISTNSTAKLNTKDELADIKEVDAGIKSIDFKVATRSGKVYVSNELIADSSFDIKAEVKAQLQKLVTNTNNAEIMDLMEKNAVAVAGSTLDDVKKAFNVSLDPALDKKIFVSQTGFNYLDTLKDTDGRYLLNYNVADETSATFLGAEVVIIPNSVFPAEKADSIDIFMGDMQQFIALFQRSQIEANWERFDSYSQGVSVVLRSDYQVIDPKAMVKLSIATTPSPVGA